MTHSTLKSPVDRTLILTCGSLAGAVGKQLENSLQALGLWQTAVTSIDIALEISSEDQLSQLQTAFQTISNVDLPQKLAQNGWRLSHLDVLTIFLIIDIVDGQLVTNPTTWYATAAKFVLTHYGLETTAMLLTPTLDTEFAVAGAPLKKLPSSVTFERGVLPLSRVNAKGLEIGSEEAFITACALILELLITAPLQDTRTRQMINNLPHTQMFIAAGAARWVWPAAQAQRWLAKHRAVTILDSWLAEDDAPAAAVQQAAAHWLAQQPLNFHDLKQKVDPLVGSITLPEWHAPQLWELRKQVRRQKMMAAELTQEQPDVLTLVMETMQEFLQDQVVALQTAVAHNLNRYPLCSLQRTQHFIEALSIQVRTNEELIVEKRDSQHNKINELSTQQAALADEMATLLEGWPTDRWQDWISVALRPWRWPNLVWQYYTLHALGRQRSQILQQMTLLEQQITVTAVVQECSNQFQKWVAHVASQVEELTDMLRVIREQLVPDKKPFADLPLERLLPLENNADVAGDTATSAALRAGVVGGLGIHLTRPDDDSLSQQLLQSAMRDMGFVKKMHAVDALLALWPADNDLAVWWQQMESAAVPLWHCDETRLTDRERAQPFKATFIFSSDGEALNGRLKLANNSDFHWENGRYPNQIALLTMQRVAF